MSLSYQTVVMIVLIMGAVMFFTLQVLQAHFRREAERKNREVAALNQMSQELSQQSQELQQAARKISNSKDPLVDDLRRTFAAVLKRVNERENQ